MMVCVHLVLFDKISMTIARIFPEGERERKGERKRVTRNNLGDFFSLVCRDSQSVI